MKRVKMSDPESLVCPVCGKRGRVLQVVGRDGPTAIPAECPACKGTGFISVGLYRKCQRYQKLVRKTYPQGVRIHD